MSFSVQSLVRRTHRDSRTSSLSPATRLFGRNQTPTQQRCQATVAASQRRQNHATAARCSVRCVVGCVGQGCPRHTGSVTNVSSRETSLKWVNGNMHVRKVNENDHWYLKRNRRRREAYRRGGCGAGPFMRLDATGGAAVNGRRRVITNAHQAEGHQRVVTGVFKKRNRNESHDNATESMPRVITRALHNQNTVRLTSNTTFCHARMN